MDPLSPMPSNGQCICGAVPYFQRSGVIGQPGHFHCPEVRAPIRAGGERR